MIWHKIYKYILLCFFLLFVSIFLSACGPDPVKKEFPLCITTFYGPEKKMKFNAKTQKIEWYEEWYEKPLSVIGICGLVRYEGKGKIDAYIKKGMYIKYHNGRLSVKEEPLDGRTRTLECFPDVLEGRPIGRNRMYTWFPTQDGLYCRIPIYNNGNILKYKIKKTLANIIGADVQNPFE